jgi:hypothetical protein
MIDLSATESTNMTKNVAMALIFVARIAFKTLGSKIARDIL